MTPITTPEDFKKITRGDRVWHVNPYDPEGRLNVHPFAKLGKSADYVILGTETAEGYIDGHIAVRRADVRGFTGPQQLANLR